MIYKTAEELIERLEYLTEEELVEEFVRISKEFKQARDNLDCVRMIATQRMEAKGATVMQGDRHNIVGTIKVDYDYSILADIREHASADELEGKYFPAHDEVVRVGENWNMTQTKKLLRRGEPFSTIINDAKMTAGRMSIKTEERKSI